MNGRRWTAALAPLLGLFALVLTPAVAADGQTGAESASASILVGVPSGDQYLLSSPSAAPAIQLSGGTLKIRLLAVGGTLLSTRCAGRRTRSPMMAPRRAWAADSR